METETKHQKIMIMIMSDHMGHGDDVLGEKLMSNYIKTLKELGPDLWQIVLINSGVKLTIESSPVLQELKSYVKEGVAVLACGTCLQHFGLTDSQQVGQPTNMLDIVAASQVADKVITIS